MALRNKANWPAVRGPVFGRSTPDGSLCGAVATLFNFVQTVHNFPKCTSAPEPRASSAKQSQFAGCSRPGLGKIDARRVACGAVATLFNFVQIVHRSRSAQSLQSHARVLRNKANLPAVRSPVFGPCHHGLQLNGSGREGPFCCPPSPESRIYWREIFLRAVIPVHASGSTCQVQLLPQGNKPRVRAHPG